MIRLTLATLALGLASALPAEAATRAFNATFANNNPPAAIGGRCPALTVTIGNASPFFATGTSNFGAFTGSQSHCLDAGPPIPPGSADVPYYAGLFTYSFASGDTLRGTYTGLLSNSGAAGIVDNVQNFLVTGGTGLFADATGSFTGIGQLRFVAGPPSASLRISDGVIETGAVPEPATWGMLIVGFGAVGAIQRKGRSAVAA